MKKVLFSLMAFLLLTSGIYSQEETPQKPSGIGIYCAFKGGINVVRTPIGRKNGFALDGVPDFGATSFLPLSDSSELALSFDLGYSTYTFMIQDADLGDDYKNSFGYIIVGANFYFNFLTAGFNIGYPVNADYGPTINTEKLNVMTELKIGGKYTILNDDTGKLLAYIQFGYMLTGIYSDFIKDDPLINSIPYKSEDKVTNELNPRAATISIGFKYMFHL